MSALDCDDYDYIGIYCAKIKRAYCLNLFSYGIFW